jgi:DNA-directed RNA polymerase specialized sigma24 family protein
MDKQELAQLLSGDSQSLKNLYDTYRTPFMDLGRTYGLEDEVLAELYQEAFVTMYKRAVKGKLHKVSNSMHDYLLGVGKYIIYDTLKTDLPDAIPSKNNALAGVDLSVKQRKIQTALNQLAPENKQLINVFYYRGLSPAAITSLFGYEYEQQVPEKILQCLMQVKPALHLSIDENNGLLIQKHLKNRLSEAEEASFNKRLKTNKHFKEEVVFLKEVYKVLATEAELQLRVQLAEFETAYQPYKKSSRLLWYLTASVIALLGMAYFFTIIQPANADNLFADNFTPYKNVVHPVIEGVQVLDQKTKAFSTYENRDYKEAIPRFEALYEQTGSSYYLFYQANALMANNEVEEATAVFQQHLKTNDALQKKTLWYLALAYLKLKEEEKAKHFLNRLIQEEGYNYQKAEALLASLE